MRAGHSGKFHGFQKKNVYFVSLPANHAQPDHPDLQAHLARPETLDNPANPDSPVKTHPQASLDPRDRQDLLDHLDSQEHPESQERQHSRSPLCRDRLESQVKSFLRNYENLWKNEVKI